MNCENGTAEYKECNEYCCPGNKIEITCHVHIATVYLGSLAGKVWWIMLDLPNYPVCYLILLLLDGSTYLSNFS